MKGGKYNPAFCQKLIDHMKEGYSFNSFGAIVGVHRATLNRWVDAHDDFKEAKGIAEAHCQLFWEKLGIQGLNAPKDMPFNSVIWIVNMCNRFGWRQRNKDDDGEKDKEPPPATPISDEEKLTLVKAARGVA